MDQKNEQIVPLRIKNLAELKRCIRPGTELVATSHSKHPTLVGLVRVVTEVQTNAYYSVVKDQPTHQYSTCNYGKGFRSDFEKASNYLFEGTTIKVLDRRSGDGSVLYEMELYPGECLVLGQKNDMEENADTLCHYPMMSWPHIMRCYMVFGHIHGNTDADYWPLIQANERMLNAGVDVNHFEPVTFEEMEANNLLYKGQSKSGLEVQP